MTNLHITVSSPLARDVLKGYAAKSREYRILQASVPREAAALVADPQALVYVARRLEIVGVERGVYLALAISTPEIPDSIIAEIDNMNPHSYLTIEVSR